MLRDPCNCMIDAGYNPSELIGVMEILKTATGPNRTSERMSTHPDLKK